MVKPVLKKHLRRKLLSVLVRVKIYQTVVQSNDCPDETVRIGGTQGAFRARLESPDIAPASIRTEISVGSTSRFNSTLSRAAFFDHGKAVKYDNAHLI